jgi:hypothetical protein
MLLPFLEYYLRPVPGFALLQPLLETLALRDWNHRRRPPPPRSVKAAVIRRFADAASRRVFVETGTFYGDMLAAVEHDFSRLYSIELHPRLARLAARRFMGDPRVSIIAGDSATALEPLLRSIAAPCVIWLDGHYSGPLTARGEGDTPVLRELDAILRCGTTRDVILIDDARLFGQDPAYPSIAEVERRARGAHPEWSVTVEDDIVQMHGA